MSGGSFQPPPESGLKPSHNGWADGVTVNPAGGVTTSPKPIPKPLPGTILMHDADDPERATFKTRAIWRARPVWRGGCAVTGVHNDWLLQPHSLPQLSSCVNIIDRFLSARVLTLAKLQLVGVTRVTRFQEIADPFGTCTPSRRFCRQRDTYVLKTLDWNLSYPSPVHHLWRASKADDYNLKAGRLVPSQASVYMRRGGLEPMGGEHPRRPCVDLGQDSELT
ncbi:hypothetical protein C8R47DRAFT_1248839 [Mycena vitilis]|nr:hypothetical protein C8R47DRAFT_1248839 [Mycena vitilis]